MSRAAAAPDRQQLHSEERSPARTALDRYLQDVGHGEADLIRRLRMLVARLPDTRGARADGSDAR